MVDRNHLLTLITAFGLVLLVTTGCGRAQSPQGSSLNDPWGVVTISPGKTLRIGVALSNTDSGSDNAETARGVELAIRDYQSVAGFPLEIVAVEAGCSEAGGQAAAAQLAGDASIVAVIGPDCSTACKSSSLIFDEGHYTAISPACAASSLSDPVQHKRAFVRTISPDALEGSLAAQYAYRELGARRVAVISDGTLETQDTVKGFEAQMNTLGGRIIATTTIIPGGSDMQPALAAIEGQSIDLVYAPLTAADAASLLMRRQTEPELAAVALLGGRYFWDTWLIEVTGQSVEGVYAAGPYITTTRLSEVNAHYQNAYNEAPPSPAYAFAYDAVGIMVGALGKVASTGDQGSLVIGRKALQDEIYGTANYSGLTGTLTCTSWGDCSTENLAVAQVQGGKWVVVYAP
jgi:branched-chain amino acid transport system substrate-binding protein